MANPSPQILDFAVTTLYNGDLSPFASKVSLNQYVLTTDARLFNARQPLPHTHPFSDINGTVPVHKSNHVSGGSDSFISGDILEATSRVIVQNSGSTVGTRRSINLIQGTNMAFTVTDSPVNERVDVTMSSTLGALTNLDGGLSNSVYGGTTAVDGGGA